MNVKNLCLSLLALTLPLSALAGGVSDGGGGTTNPSPANPEWVLRGATEYGPQAILTWLHAEEGNYRRRSAEERAQSPYRKLFDVSPSIYDVVKNARIEFRMNEPCYDKNGEPREGSIWGTSPGAICISPFQIAPKLNEMNVDAETIALVVHELTHLLGTDEDEAKLIQQHAVWAFSRMDLLNLKIKIDLLQRDESASDFGMLFFQFEVYENPLQKPRGPAMEYMIQSMLKIRDALSFSQFHSLLVPEATIDAFVPQFARLEVLQNQACLNDQGETTEMHAYCQERLDTAFRGQSSATAQEVQDRWLGQSIDLGDGSQNVVIQRPLSPELFVNELKATHEFLVSVRKQLTELSRARFTAVRR